MAGLESHYRKVLNDEDNFKKLISGLGAADPLPLLVKYNGLSSIEGSELKASLRGKLSRERNPVIINRILQKASLISSLICTLNLGRIVRIHFYAWSLFRRILLHHTQH